MPFSRRMRDVALTLATTSIALGLAPVLHAADPATLRGELVTVEVDAAPGRPAPDDAHFLATDDGLVPVTLPAGSDIDPGTQVTATLAPGSTWDGTEPAELAAATVTAPAVEASAAPAAHRAYVVTVDDPTATGDVTPAAAAAMTASATAYWVRESRGAIPSFATAGSASLTYPGSCTADPEDLWAAAAAAFPGVNLTDELQRNHLVVYAPAGCDVGYIGLAYRYATPLVGGAALILDDAWSTVAHELGHNLGLRHANVEVTDPILGVPVSWEYYAGFGPQGARFGSYEPGALDAAFQDALGLPGVEAQRTTLAWDDQRTIDTHLTLRPVGSLTGLTAARFTDREGTTFYVEYRGGGGDDARSVYAADRWTAPEADTYLNASPGVVVSRLDPRNDLAVLGSLSAPEPGYHAEFWSSHHQGEVYQPADGSWVVSVLRTTTDSAQVAIVLKNQGTAVQPGPRASRTRTTTTLTAPTGTAGVPTTVGIRVRDAAGRPIVETRPTDMAGAWIEILRDGTPIADTWIDDSLTGAFTVPALPAGTYVLTARYAGWRWTAPSVGTATLTVLGALPSTVRATTLATTYGRGGAVTFTVASTATPTGTVTVREGTTALATLPLVGGRATYRVPTTFAAGAHALTARYSGSAQVAASSATTKVTVAKATAGARLIGWTNLGYNRRASLVVQLTGVGAQPPTGVVVARINGRAVSLATPVVRTRGVYKAFIGTAKLPKGVLTITYSGNANLAPGSYPTGVVIR